MIDNDIKQAIEKNLSHEVGSRLAERLKKLENYETNESNVLSSLKELVELRGRENDLLLKEKDVKLREINLDKRQIEIEKKEAVLEVKIKCQERSEMTHLEIVKAVFANNRYKYTSHGGMSGSAGYQSVDKTIETES